MKKRVLDVGNCVPDHAAVRRLMEDTFDAEVAQAHGPEDALKMLRQGHFDLVVVNRKLDRDYTDGLDIIKAIKADAELAPVPCMLITNYPDQQQVAVEAGAEPGFGKKSLHSEETHARLAKFLS